MNPYSIEQIYSDLQSKFSDMIGEIRIEPPTTGTPFIIVNREWIRDVCLYLRDDEKYKMNTCNLLSCVDFRKMKSQEYNNQLGVVYHLSSLQETKNGWETIHKCALRVYIPIDDPKIASVSRIWRSTDWHEREGYDMYGIIFEEHPDLRRILLPDDWVGFPLRKDYETPEYYNGMKIPY
ncbi:MAG: NADH-quinone oxidoreductase subunit C [Chlorobiota bacterium]|jgi:NADH-quinone oxidoreductase subunit C|nr:NADH-quinone oxidoreductase subunit C [Chlorobiota bacterium]QQS65792.1 MAG: NADH-quinone oxidoreductase subunit C [Chlorobiota bacterium]